MTAVRPAPPFNPRHVAEQAAAAAPRAFPKANPRRPKPDLTPRLAIRATVEQISAQMVAETSPIPQTRAKGKFRPTFPLPQKLKVRSLYVIQQLSPAEIGEQVGLTRKQVQSLISREGWVATKRRAKASFLAKHDARVKEEVAEVHEAVAVQTEALSLGTLDKARITLDRDDINAARDLQAYSQAAKNFVGIARQARGLDTENRNDRNGATVVFVQLERVGERSERNVTPPAIEIPAAPKELPPANPA